MAGVTTLDALAERVAQGEALRDEDAPLILESHDLIAIGMMADEVRRRARGTDTTFVRVFEMHVDAVPAALPPNLAAGEFRIVGRPASPEAARDAVAAARTLAGKAPLFAFALGDLEGLSASLPAVFALLKSAGLDGIAEVALDARPSPSTLAAARSAGLDVFRLTVHAASRDLIALFSEARDLVAQAGTLRAFAPLPRTLSVSAPTTGYDDVKAVALARLLLPAALSIQVDWPLYGPKLAQVGLTVGADDIDGIVAVDAGALGSRRSALEEVRGNIRAAGLTAIERDGRFQRVAAGEAPTGAGSRG